MFRKWPEILLKEKDTRFKKKIFIRLLSAAAVRAAGVLTDSCCEARVMQFEAVIWTLAG